jgi:hypothetical protein
MLSVFVALSLFAATDAPKLRSIEANVQVDVQGHVESFAWRHPEQVSAAVHAVLAPRVNAVEFEPARKNGVAAKSQVQMNVIVQTTENADGTGQLRFISVEKIGARVIKEPAPRYPEDMLRHGTSAQLILSAVVGTDGKVIASSVALDGEVAKRDSDEIAQFFKSAKRSLLASQFELTETVEGVPVPGAMKFPFVFCVNDCAAINAEVERLKVARSFQPLPESGIELASLKAGG